MKKGETMSPALKEKISLANKGQVPWCAGVHMSETQKKNMYGRTPWNKGVVMPPEVGQKISSTLKAIGHKPAVMREDQHPRWTGDKVAYRPLHLWVERMLGKPRHCSNCDSTSLPPRNYHWANISGKYLRNLLDWVRLCVKCHYAFDHGLLTLTT